ncbi:phosphoribosylformimino-5-aminoimidazole carboxamide ribotide isomerase [Clostridium tetanomorphum]|uniref:1-(5-phosphoribosyl)-5-[(5-phosphoribosylamino)methylideneamino] imidazole-4-carboxamide isomerase n=1 Tax=Clostridium tetanomorphum TaxID=1553 RepID=A0A923EAZ3_CLOTT|nr:1-(5-phosphoribosyl)-5-[(5-phosphoribosylamino)methylideneamino]imidazole-4-carboxamide isomerase [Clostridium tetanomorphum]KAJ49821.1 1-(5-phosphoribosyl)-5-[(5-phosphoribosylamino)methyliden eamino] imidazole-4-carboxamide isomerase [Clostridium tetanomorphum DSM 665]MBC2399720.1 1-(5-phosphoribosyl)-5-[(5-phosphoribosylamino)methylideneamino]imidazole-4-carboxamide isomerase [Clostridium tetanomorphum]MBP1865123.1 phosphoribosylformimino-5-aminoimidazole carboxamide ribotide isomerase [Cl
MIIFPAIDIKNNKCVRLSQGDFNKLKVYSNEPFEMAVKWREQGVSFLHLVDLDGARSEEFINKKSIEKIVKNIGLPVQIGGGIRSIEKVRSLLAMGVERVIVGTIAVENKKLLKELISKYNEKIVVSIDAKEGKVATRAWEVVSEISSIDLCKELEDIGVKTIVYTDISKDGMLGGPNFDIYKILSKKTKLNIIASGGITRIEDILKLKAMNIYGGIIGKAFYDNLLDYKEVEKCLQKE